MYFKSIEAISKATIEDLKQVPGISHALAKAIRSYFSGQV